MACIAKTPARWAALASIAALLTACAAGPTPRPTQPTQPGAPSAPSGPAVDPIAPYASSGNAAMDAWRATFASRASSRGHDPAVIRSVLDGLTPLDIYLSDNVTAQSTDISDQAEFAKPIWEYLRTAVSEARRERGIERVASNVYLFDDLEEDYGVNREVLAAIWGMETNFGSYMGSYDAANTLANMAVEGRRRSFAEGELLALIQMIEGGQVTRAELISGWAGAMGHTQFMPSTFLGYARDYEGDGHIDLWTNPADALASAANYLSASGYVFDQPWGLEVRLPEGFDYSVADGQDRRLSSWEALGLQYVDTARGDALPDGTYAELWVPAGHRGPKYLLFANFDVFKTYNRADSYAFAVGLLSDQIAGHAGPSVPWPTDLQPLSVAQIRHLQAGLNAMGYEAGPVDGIAGRGTRGALRRFQVDNGFIADGYPTTEMLAYVLSASG